MVERKAYNDWVWSRVLKTDAMARKLQNSGFLFHHEITTYAWRGHVSALFQTISLDIVSIMDDEQGISLRYSSSQRNFESGLTLSSRKKRKGMA